MANSTQSPQLPHKHAHPLKSPNPHTHTHKLSINFQLEQWLCRAVKGNNYSCDFSCQPATQEEVAVMMPESTECYHLNSVPFRQVTVWRWCCPEETAVAPGAQLRTQETREIKNEKETDRETASILAEKPLVPDRTKRVKNSSSMRIKNCTWAKCICWMLKVTKCNSEGECTESLKNSSET